jgi:3',5'-cyclic AMP phosphodiesterase CpdA
LRVLHFTDLHLFRPPSPRGLISKRLLGTANLYLARRIDHFSQRSIELLVQAVLEQEPDLCVCSGDLTGMASPDEFAEIRRLLDPVLERFPVALVPGNHDVYTGGAFRERRLEAEFGHWTGGGGYPVVHEHGEVKVVGLDCARPHLLLSSGVLPQAQLEGLEALLSSGQLEGSFNILLLHYPLRNAAGAPYGGSTRNLVNAAALEDVLRRHKGIDLIVHGHEHHGFGTELETPWGGIPIHDPGAGGRSWAPQRHETAHFNVYRIEDRALAHVERWALEDSSFVLEPGGPYSSGR